MIDPEHCTTMAEVRAGIDQLDDEIVQLLAKRFGFIEAAGRIKQHRTQVRDDERKAFIIERVRKAAIKAGIPDQVIARLYDDLIEASINFEFARFDAKE